MPRHSHNSHSTPSRPSGGDWIYGRRPVAEALRAGRRQFRELRVLDTALRDGSGDTDLREICFIANDCGLRVVRTDRRDLENLLGPVNHQGVALRAGGFAYGDFDQLLRAVEEDQEAIVLVLDHIEDPQNVGSLLRTADAAGVAGVVIPEDRSAGVTAAAVRASAGASEHLCVVRVVNLVRALASLKEAGCWITGLDWGDDAKGYTEVDYRGRCAIVVGNEGHGIGRLVRDNCDFIAQLPMRGGVASLNASVAGGIVLYEALRQKGAGR